MRVDPCCRGLRSSCWCSKPLATTRSGSTRQVVAESYEPGAVVSEVARRHDITPQHLFGWRKAARTGRLVLPATEPPLFVPVVTATGGPGAAGAVRHRAGSIAIEIAGTVVHAEPGIDLGWLRDVLRAVKAAT
jgi:transposase